MSEPDSYPAPAARVLAFPAIPAQPNLIQRVLGVLLRRHSSQGRSLLGDLSVVSVAPPLRAATLRAGMPGGDAQAA